MTGRELATINGVDFDDVTDQAVNAARAIVPENWEVFEEIVKNIGENLTKDVEFLRRKQASGEVNEDDAREFLGDQKTRARAKLRSVAVITVAERIWTAIAEVFRTPINTALGWDLLRNGA